MNHEWIKIYGVTICHWCGVSKKKHHNTKCISHIKITTKGNKLKLERR